MLCNSKIVASNNSFKLICMNFSKVNEDREKKERIVINELYTDMLSISALFNSLKKYI
jgi:hypothetical protein